MENDKESCVDETEEIRKLHSLLSKRKRSIKDVESTVAGGATTQVEIFLPSFFELYPRVEQTYEAAQDNSEKLRILAACEKVLAKGDDKELWQLVEKTKKRKIVIDLTSDEDHVLPAGTFKWQADIGESWMDYDPQSCARLEEARVNNVSVVQLYLYGNSYKIDIERNMQINSASGTARPIRRVSLL